VCKGTNKRAKSKRKECFSLGFSSESTFGKAKGTNYIRKILAFSLKMLYLCGNQIITDVMALNTDKNLKLYYSIKEVAEIVGVSESNLRFWEKEIPLIRPKTTGNNIRQYTDKDVENIKAVYNLVKVRGFKLAAARKMLRENKQGVDNNTRVMESLMKVRDDLKALKKQLDYLT
jgi:DNA-binding transcriptional MerR regulator